MSLSKGLSAVLLLFKRPAGCLSVASQLFKRLRLFKGHSERAGGREDEGTKNEGRRTKNDNDDDNDDDLIKG